MVNVRTYSQTAIPHLESLISKNEKTMERIASQLVSDVSQGKSLLVFGSGHSSIFPLELYHRAGGASFVVPVVADYLLPTAGPPVVRVLERTAGVATAILARAEPKEGEMLWLSSNSGINAAVVDLALEAKKKGMRTVAFTSLPHSQSVASRHPSGKRLFEVCDETIDIGGVRGDASIAIASGVAAGPLSTLSTVMLGHSILVAAIAGLEAKGIPCVYTSVNTPEGEARNVELERIAQKRDPLLRG
ncbi:MAG: sugar isomerase domain-containing protein [Bdellovibrionia bacterium]